MLWQCEVTLVQVQVCEKPLENAPLFRVGQMACFVSHFENREPQLLCDVFPSNLSQSTVLAVQEQSHAPSSVGASKPAAALMLSDGTPVAFF